MARAAAVLVVGDRVNDELRGRSLRRQQGLAVAHVGRAGMSLAARLLTAASSASAAYDVARAIEITKPRAFVASHL